MSTQVSSIKQIAITVSDVDKALEFYRDILGLEFLFSAGPNLAFLNADGVRIMLSTPQGANSILYFNVNDIESSYKTFVEQGAKAERQPQLAANMPDHDLWTVFLRDPDDNLVGLMEEKAHG